MTHADQRPRRPRRKPGENRERLVLAGIHEFGHFGFHAASTTAIAARAGVPQPHVYASFSTKRDLYFACVARALTDLAQQEFPPSQQITQTDAYLLLYQSVASLGNASLKRDLLPYIRRLRRAVGKTQFERMLIDAAGGLES